MAGLSVGCNYPVTADRRSKGVVDYHARRSWSSAASPLVGSTSTETDIAISSLLLDLHPYPRSSHGRPTTLSRSWLGRIDFALLPGHARGSDCADEDESKGDSPERSQPGPATSTHRAKPTRPSDADRGGPSGWLSRGEDQTNREEITQAWETKHELPCVAGLTAARADKEWWSTP
jgi:hypothetical protein